MQEIQHIRTIWSKQHEQKQKEFKHCTNQHENPSRRADKSKTHDKNRCTRLYPTMLQWHRLKAEVQIMRHWTAASKGVLVSTGGFRKIGCSMKFHVPKNIQKLSSHFGVTTVTMTKRTPQPPTNSMALPGEPRIRGACHAVAPWWKQLQPLPGGQSSLAALGATRPGQMHVRRCSLWLCNIAMV